ASASAARTSAYGACSPSKVGQLGPVVGAGGGGGGGSSSFGGFSVGRGAGVVWRTGARVRLGAGLDVGLGVAVGVGVADGVTVGVDVALCAVVPAGRNAACAGSVDGSIAQPRPTMSTTAR